MRTICYYPELVETTGSINAALMMAQLEFWFKVTGGRPFYKFLEPCGHELYKEGDSWAEELGMSSSEIRSAFKRIGTIYKSKRAYKESQDVFKGKPYASYYDRIRKTTYYLRNTEKAQKIMPKDILLEIGHEVANRYKKESTYKQTDSYVTQDSAVGDGSGNGQDVEQVGDGSGNGQDVEQVGDGSGIEKGVEQVGDGSGNGQGAEQDRDGSGNGQGVEQDRDGSVTDQYEDGLYREDYIDYNIQDKQIKEQKESYSLIPYTEIVKLYNDHLGEVLGYIINLPQQEKDSMKALWLKFNMKLENFKKGFMKVAASRFLCGKVEGKKWRASLKWLLTGNHLSKVLAGMYDDFVTHSVAMPKCTGLDKVKQFNQMESHNWDFDEIERLERLYIDKKLGIL